MADQLKISFPLKDLQRFASKIDHLGREMDKLEKTSVNHQVKTLFNKAAKSSENLRQNLSGLSKQLGVVMDVTETTNFATEKFFNSLVFKSREADLAMKGLTGTNKDLFKVMVQTANQKMLNKHLEDLATQSTRLNIAFEKSKVALDASSKSVIKNADINRVAEKGTRSRATAEEQLKQKYLNSQKALELFGSETAKKLRLSERELAAANQLEVAESKRTAGLAKITAEIAALNTKEGQSELLLKEQLKTKQALVSADSKRSRVNLLLQSELAALNTEEGRSAVLLKEQVSAKKNLINLEAKRGDTAKRLRSEIAYLNTEEGRSSVLLKEQLNTKRNLIAEEGKRRQAILRLKGELASLNTEEGRQSALLKEEIRVKRDLITEEARRNAVIEKTRRELAYLRSEQGKSLIMMRQQIAEEQRATVARVKNTGAMTQANAAFRASLTGLRSSIGMYTSGTILTATAVYGLSRAFRTGLEQGAEFTATMARSNAIFNTTADVMAVVENKVRALGKTTQYTSSEAGQALIELGMAGLTAGEAVSALKPTLDLATIGGIGLAESAKLSTDLLLMFGKRASELSEIVDTMAAAVTNSNATVSELTNAISYAGPAAATLGMSLEDVTASVGVLANAGIRGSRAGTALRRMFLNLAKPTAAGQAAMDKYGISVTDFNGKTRDLTTVLELFSDKLSGLSNEDKLKTLTEIFGVRAASGVNSLVRQADEVRIFREQLDLTADAAKNMQEKIRDNLQFDAQELRSAFQEMQLAMFKDNEMTFRIWTQELKGFVNYLGESTDGVRTRLEVMISSIAKFGRTLAIIVAANYTVKIFLTMRNAVYALAASTAVGRAAMIRFGVGMTHVTAASAAASGSVRGLSLSLAALRTAIFSVPVVGWILGIGAAAYTAYEVISALYSEDTNRDIQKQNELLREQRDVYDQIKRENKARDLVTSLEAEKEAHKQSLKLLGQEQKRLESLQSIREKMSSEGQDTSFMNKRVAVQEAEINKLKETLRGLDEGVSIAEKNLETFADKSKLEKELDEWNAVVVSKSAELEKSLSGRDINYMSPLASTFFRVASTSKETLQKEQDVAKNHVERIVAELDKLAASAETTNNKLSEAFDINYDPFVGFQAKLKEARDEALKGLNEGKKTDFGTMIGVESNVGELMSQAKDFNKILDTLREKSKTSTGLTSSEKSEFVNIWSEMEAALGRVVALQKDLATSQLKNYEHRKGLLAEILVQEDASVARQGLLNTLTGGGNSEAQTEINLMQRKVELQAEVNRLTSARNYQEATKVQKELNKTEADLDKMLNARIATYHSLYAAAKPVIKAEEEFIKTQEDLNKLLNDTDLGYEKYLAAMDQAWLKKQKVIDANDKELQSLLRLRKAYGNTKSDTFLQDKGDLSSLRKAGYGDSLELDMLEENLKKKEFDSYQFKEPEVISRNSARSIELAPMALSMIDVGKGHQEYADLGLDIETRFQDRVLSSQREFDEEKVKINEREYLGAAERQQDLLELQQEYAEKMIAANEAKNDAMRESDEKYANYVRHSNMLLVSEAVGFGADMAAQLSEVAEEGSRTQRNALLISKALAATQIIMNAHLAASKIGATDGTPTISAPAIKAMTLAQGYSSAAMVAAMAIKQYDKGGYIPDGEIGIVGEIGPEIVHGPANVTSRKETMSKLSQAAENNGGGGSNIKIVNAFDTKVIGNYLGTPEGEKLLLNTVKRNRQTIKRYVG